MKPEQVGLYVGIGVLIIGIFLVDVRMALGFTPWLLYVIPLGLTYWAIHLPAPLVVAGLCTALIFVGYDLSVPLVAPHVAVTNRLFGSVTFWVLGSLIASQKLLAARLTKLTEELRAELVDRTRDLGRAVRVLRVVAEQGAHTPQDRAGAETELTLHVTDVLTAESRRLRQHVTFLVQEKSSGQGDEAGLESTRSELERLGRQLEQLQRDLLRS